MKQLASRLREVREMNHLNQVALASELNVKPATISRYENNTSDPDSDTILWYAKRFSVSVDYLYGLTDNPLPISTSANDLTEDELIETGEAVEITEEQLKDRLPPDIRDIVSSLIKIEIEKIKKK